MLHLDREIILYYTMYMHIAYLLVEHLASQVMTLFLKFNFIKVYLYKVPFRFNEYVQFGNKFNHVNKPN